MRNYITLIIATFAITLSGCSMFESKPEPMPQVVSAPTPAPTPPVVVSAPDIVPVPAASDTGARIPIGSFLDKLVAGGCKIESAKYREIDSPSKTGGHVEVKCKAEADTLSMDNDL